MPSRLDGARMTPAAARRSAAGTAPRRQQTRKVAAHWYPAIAAVERDTACAEMERLARGVAPSRAWEECEPLAPTPLGVAVGGRAAVGVERLLQVLEEKKGLQRVEQLANLLEGSAKEAAIPVDARGFNGQTTMAVAATSGNADVMQLLLRYGADVNIANSRGWTPLMLACQRNREASLAVLLGARALADVALLNRDGDSALTIALAAGHTEVCTKLVRAGATLPTMLGPGSATDARDRALDLARKGLHLTALSGATDVVRQCLRVIETRDWDRNKPPAMSAKPAEEQAMAGLGVDADEAMLFARTGERVNKYLWPGHRLAKGMERRREELRERGIELLWEAEGKKRRLSKGTVVLLAPGQENTGNGALRGDETGTVIKVTPEEDRVRVKGPSGRHCWYAIDELLSWQEKKAVEQDSDEAEDEADPGLPDFAGDGDGRGGDSSPVWGISELIHKHESATSGFQASEDERHYLQEMRRQEATRHQKELWQKQKERRVHKKGTAAQALLTEAFAEAGGKTPQGSELQDLVAATRVREEEVVEWFSYTRKQAKARQAGLRWGNAGGTLMGAGSEDDLLRRVDEAEEEVRKKKHPKMKAQEDREEAHENWVEKWGGEAPSSKERKRLGEKRIGEPLLVDPNEEVEDEAEAAQRAWEDKMMADKNTPAQALVARRKRQQELDGLGQQLTGDGGGMVRLSGGMLNQRNAVTAADIGGGGGVPGGSGASSLDSLTQALRVARSYDNSMFQHKLTAQLGEANSKSSAKMMRTAQKAQSKQADHGKARWQYAHNELPSDPMVWSVDTVCRWLRKLGLGGANQNVRGRHIDGAQLTYMHIDTFVKLIGSGSVAGDVSEIDGNVDDWSSSGGAVKKAAARAIQFLQAGFDEERMSKRVAARLKLDKKDAYNPFHMAIIAEDEEAVARYIKKGRYDVNDRTALGHTPLMLAVGTGDQWMVKMLIEAGAVDPMIPVGAKMASWKGDER